MPKKILFSLMAILLAVGLVGAGAFAQFFDTETSKGNTFTAGTLDLTVDDQDDPDVVSYTIGPIAPGWGCRYTWTLKNVGSLPGILSVEISDIENYENYNAATDEAEVYDATKNPSGDTDTSDGTGVGELGDKIIVGKVKFENTRLYTRSADGSKEWKYPWVKDLNNLGGRTLYAPFFSTLGILESEEEEMFFFDLRLDPEVGNCVQGDSVSFDIIFHLDQVP